MEKKYILRQGKQFEEMSVVKEEWNSTIRGITILLSLSLFNLPTYSLFQHAHALTLTHGHPHSKHSTDNALIYWFVYSEIHSR